MIRSRSTLSLGVVAIFFFMSGIAYMRLFDWTMAVTNTESFCIGCHEMKDNVYPAYTESIHYSIGLAFALPVQTVMCRTNGRTK